MKIIISFIKENAQVLGLMVTIAGAIVSYLFGPKLFRKLISWRMDDLHDRNQKLNQRLTLAKSKSRDLRTQLKEVSTERDELRAKFDRVKVGYKSELNKLWLRKPIIQPFDYHEKLKASIPIILVANLKGGVGKTTIAANLAAFFDDVYDENVLAIDLDWQGSLSSMLLPELRDQGERTAQNVMHLLGGEATGLSAMNHTEPMRETQYDSRIVECFYAFSNFESQLEQKWIIGESPEVRYNLANVLLSAEIQDKFHRIIIDAPPRITLGFINALCASTHLIIPTNLDVLSGEAVGSFLQELGEMNSELFPNLKLAAVVGNFKATGNNKQLRGSEKSSIAGIKALMKRELSNSGYFLEQHLIPKTEKIAEYAGKHVAYQKSGDVRQIFDSLGHEIYERTTGKLVSKNADQGIHSHT